MPAAWESAPVVDSGPAWASAPEVGAAKDEAKSQGSRARAQAQSANTLSDTVKALAEGGLTGAADIGNTILTPVRTAANWAAPKRQNLSGLVTGAAPKREGVMGPIADYLEEMKAGPDKQSAMNADHPIAFGLGRTGAQIAMTAPLGGAIAETLGKAPVIAKYAPNLLEAIKTSGMSAGPIDAGKYGQAVNMLTRMAGGGITGGATAGLIDPDSAEAGALIGALLPPVVSGSGYVGHKVGGLFRGEPANPAKVSLAQQLQQKGLVVPPSDVQPQNALVELAGGLSGKAKTAQVASSRNQPLINKLIASEDLGLPQDTPITLKTLDDIRAQAGKAYDKVRALGVRPADVAPLPDSVGIQQGMDKLTFAPKKEVDMAEVVRAWKQANHDATGYFRAYARDANPETLAKARAAETDAKMIDDFMASTLKAEGSARSSQPDLIGTLAKGYISPNDFVKQVLSGAKPQVTGNEALLSELKDARRMIAKTHTVEKALNTATNDISVPVLVRELEKNKPLSGAMRDVAQYGQAFPKAFQSLKEAPKDVSPLDFAMALTAAASTGNLASLGLLGARPMARSALLSKAAQKYASKEATQNALSRIAADYGPQLLYRSVPALVADR